MSELDPSDILAGACDSLAFVRDSLDGNIRDQAARTLTAVAELMRSLDPDGCRPRDPARTYDHDPLCDDNGWNHRGPCVLDPFIGLT